MRISLIGMSGTGKSYWSKQMEAEGFRRFSCDELIAERLGPKMDPKGKLTMSLASWMGHPYEDGYADAETLYLDLEREVVKWICEELETDTIDSEQIVVDTTGSLIYLEETLIRLLRARTSMVYLNLPCEYYKKNFETFLRDPKPVIWGPHYRPWPNESPQESLNRCYEELVAHRVERYRQIADCTLDYSFHHAPGTGLKKLLEIIGGDLMSNS